MKKILTVVLLSTLLFAGCKKDSPVATEPEGGLTYLSFGPAFSLTKTSVPLEEAISAQVVGSLEPNDFTIIYLDSQIPAQSLDQPVLFSAPDGIGGLKNKVAYGNSSIVSIRAFAPIENATRKSNKVDFIGLTGAEDVVLSQLNLSVGSTTAVPGAGNGSKDSPEIPLVFSHKLAKVSFSIKGGVATSGAEASASWGKITKVELSGHPNAVSIDLTTNFVTTSSDPQSVADIIVHEGRAYDIPTNTAPAIPLTGFALVPAKTGFTVTVYSETVPGGRPAVFTNVLEEGKHHAFTLVLGTDMGMTLTATIIDWAAGAGGDLPIN